MITFFCLQFLQGFPAWVDRFFLTIAFPDVQICTAHGAQPATLFTAEEFQGHAQNDLIAYFLADVQRNGIPGDDRNLIRYGRSPDDFFEDVEKVASASVVSLESLPAAITDKMTQKFGFQSQAQ